MTFRTSPIFFLSVMIICIFKGHAQPAALSTSAAVSERIRLVSSEDSDSFYAKSRETQASIHKYMVTANRIEAQQRQLFAFLFVVLCVLVWLYKILEHAETKIEVGYVPIFVLCLVLAIYIFPQGDPLPVFFWGLET